MLYISFGIARQFITVVFHIFLLFDCSISYADIIFLFQFCFSLSLKCVPKYISTHSIRACTEQNTFRTCGVCYKLSKP